MDYAEEGSLLKYIQEHVQDKKQIPEAQIWKFLHDICRGIKCSHDIEIIHRDIHADNILLMNGTCKICDFGISKKADDYGNVYTNVWANILNQSPEMLEGPYSFGLDCW